MTKPKKLRDNRMQAEKDERVLPQIGEPLPEAHHVVKPRRFVPRPCTNEICNKQGNFSYCYKTRTENGRRYHYCKCKLCNNPGWVQETKL